MEGIRTFNLTVSVKGDISDECIESIRSYVNSQTEFHYIVVEGETSKLHLHAVLYYKYPMNKTKLRENIMTRKVKPFHPDAGRAAVNLHVCPGRKWVDEYLRKEESVREISKKLPANLDDLNDRYPSPETQALLIAASEGQAQDTIMAMHSSRYGEFLEGRASTTMLAHEYLNWRMYVKHDLRHIEDYRFVFRKAIALHKWHTQDQSLEPEVEIMHRRYNGDYDFTNQVYIGQAGS